MDSAPMIPDTLELITVLHPMEGHSTEGTVIFKSLENGKVEVSGRITGSNPDSEHGFHIHQYGDLTAKDASSAGSHYNPLDHQHGMPSEETRHAGDFGNIEADANGVASFKFVVDNISLAGQKNPIIGRSVIVHAKADDGSQPSGNAGERIAGGVIGVRNPSESGKQE